MRRAEGTLLYMNGNFADFSLPHLTRGQKRRRLTFCLWITVRWVPSKKRIKGRGYEVWCCN